MDDASLRAWVEVLDELSYYQLLGVDEAAHHDAVRAAFHAFAEAFHPDVHRARDPEEQAAIGAIYRRGTEAYRVLASPTLRPRYDAALAGGALRIEDLPGDEDAPSSLPRSLSVPPPASENRLRSPGARPFVLRAEELVKKGDPKQAKLQLVMAMHIDPNNPALAAFAAELDAAIARKTAEKR